MCLQVSGDSNISPSLQPSLPPLKSEYNFDFPAELCGMLIGRHGANIKDLKDRSGCEITVKDKLYTADTKLICLEGRTIRLQM